MSSWTTQVRNGILTALYSNPPQEYYTDAAVDELAAHVQSWATMDLRAIILAGSSSGAFITHFSPDEIRRGIDDPAAVAARGPARNTAVNRVLDDITRLRVPVIAALNGDTMGFGFELALACDFRIGESGDYRYGFPEVRLGVIPGSGGTQRLVRLVGLGKAMDVVLRARVLTPEKALAFGMLTELHTDAVAASLKLAEELSTLPGSAVAMAKRALHLGADAPLAAALTIESEASVRAKLSPDAQMALDEYLSVAPHERRRWLEADPLP